tara:strand:- start:618 stop:2078 length:1461 start_codon:yes stop_codon:yes gene_type:complete
MPTIIEQQPLYKWQMGADDFLCTVSNDAVVSGVPTGYFNVKILAEVFISNTTINTALATQLIGTFKAIPNNKGRGIFNFKSVIENHVIAQNDGYEATDVLPASRHNGVPYISDATPHSIHVIDRFALNTSSLRYLKIQFKLEGATALGGPVSIISGTAINSIQFSVTNTYVPVDATYFQSGMRYSWADTTKYYMNFDNEPTQGYYLTNMPLYQNVNQKDYHTMSFLNSRLPYLGTDSKYTFFHWYKPNGVLINSVGVQLDPSNGAEYPTITDGDTDTKYVTVGCGPANLRNQNVNFRNDLDAGLIGYYTVEQRTSNQPQDRISQLYYFNIECAPFNNYEPIRICWLNQLGAWDYYSFNRKSTTSLSTKKSDYTQLAGSWNGEYWQRKGWKGGSKTFRSNTTTKIKMNTAYISEDYNQAFEELMNSPEIYVLNEWVEFDSAMWKNNKYVHPAKLKTSSFTRKTKANDNLIQYSFEIEMSKTQAVQNA